VSSIPPAPAPPPTLVPWRGRFNLNPARWGVPALAEVAVCIALSAALGLVKVFTMPQGGSVSLEMLPILFLAVRRGFGPALIGGFLYGLLQLVLPGAFIYHPAQAALDYPLAYAALAAAALVPVRGWWSLAAAVAAGCGARLVFHFLSGWMFFATYAPSWEAPWLYSITYNLLYLVPEALITAFVLWPLLRAYDAAFPTGGRGSGAAS
jgi:thiamine transporter